MGKNVEGSKMMYGLWRIVEEHGCIRDFFDVSRDENLRMIVDEFVGFIEIKEVGSCWGKYDLEGFFKEELSS
ncbi:hypothetical protein [Staphylococcus aureus]|uniref:hypothetical protein n=1 Tax=Staphylococcus aureus TaxID=1280 RepID=UPI0011A1F7C0|nr:hypothetical protein [Staphylococcus aureus]